MNQLGVIGLGTMGANLARNAANQGVQVVVYNRTSEKTDAFIDEFGTDGDFVKTKTLKNFIKKLETPRAILLMVKAGNAVDAVIEELTPLLDKEDIIIDAGNSLYTDTERRVSELQEKNIHYVGMGVSGGEEGALLGPSMMPGGSKEAYEQLQELLSSMAAEDGADGTCVSYIGEGGAGHFVKMVHNGIEYGVMQLIAESYDLLKHLGNFSNEELAETYHAWNEAEFLDSFLIEITADIFEQHDDRADGDLIDVIVDRAGQKGTGKWTTNAALHYGVAIPSINAAVDARIVSGSTELRKHGKDTPFYEAEHDPIPPKLQLRSQVRSALKQSVICAYLQGFALMTAASEEEGWKLDASDIARIWRGGCIIRSALLEKFQALYGDNAANRKAAEQAVTDRFSEERQRDWRRVVALGSLHGIGVPAMSASLSWYDGLRRERLPQSLIQAQRDFFGAHTYERTDIEGVFHTEWTAEVRK